MELLAVHIDGKEWSRDGELCRRIITWRAGGKGSAWILLPAGSTSFPPHCSLNAAPDFKDIGSTVTARPRNSAYCFTAA